MLVRTLTLGLGLLLSACGSSAEDATPGLTSAPSSGEPSSSGPNSAEPGSSVPAGNPTDDNGGAGLAGNGGSAGGGTVQGPGGSLGASSGGTGHEPASAGGASPGGASTAAAGGVPATDAGVVVPLDPAPGLCSIQIVCDVEIDEDERVLCEFEVRDSAGSVFYADHAGIKFRGRSSLNFPKKHYSVELHDVMGEDNPANLLGMGGDEDWILDGAWADRSLMRNSLAYDLFRDMGHYASKGRFCNLWLNGEAQGIYRLGERVKRDDDRVVLPTDDGSGSTFVIKQDAEGLIQFGVGRNDVWQVVYPRQAAASEAQLSGVQAWFDEFETAMRNPGSDGAALAAYLESSTAADWILLQELSKNIDAYNLSIHLSRAAGSPAQLIPWDFDLAFGQPTVAAGAPEGEAAVGNETPAGWVWNRTEFIALLSNVESLRLSLGPRWRELRTGVLSDAAVMARVDAYQADLVSEAVAMNFAIWPIEDVEFTSIYAPYSFYEVASYSEEVEALRGWLQERLLWLDANIDDFPIGP